MGLGGMNGFSRGAESVVVLLWSCISPSKSAEDRESKIQEHIAARTALALKNYKFATPSKAAVIYNNFVDFADENSYPPSRPSKTRVITVAVLRGKQSVMIASAGEVEDFLGEAFPGLHRIIKFTYSAPEVDQDFDPTPIIY